MTTRLDVATQDRTDGRAALLLALAAALWAPAAQAQVTAGGHVALQGTYIEIGVNRNGAFGIPQGEVPAGYHWHSDPGNGLGFVSDYRKTGWAGQYGGDYFTPGYPFEGFYVKWGSGFVAGNSGAGDEGIPSIDLVDTSSGDTRSVVWTGEVSSGGDRLKVVQTYAFKAGDLFFTANTQLINTGTTTLASVKFAREVDPDNDESWTGDYTTVNRLVAQPPSATNRALVTATGLGVTDMTLGLGAIDARARVSASYRGNDPDLILVNPQGDNTDDTWVGLAFAVGDLAPGQSVSLDYAYILSAADLDTALGALAAVTILQPTGTVSGHAVPFSVTTNDLARTSQVAFYVGGTLIGSSAAPVGGVFSTTFDSLAYPNGALAVKAVATIDGVATEKSTTVLVDNSGPPLAFTSPANGAAVGGAAVPIILATDPLNEPSSVVFYREVAGLPSVVLGTVTATPFATSADLTDLAAGTAVTIRAVGTNLSGESTNVTVGVLVASGPAAGQPAGGGAQTLPAGGGASGPICVLLLDGGGQPMAGQVVTFTAPASGASAALVSPVTSGADGLACTVATPNHLAGTYQVTASAGAFTMTAATLVNRPGPAVQLAYGADGVAEQSVVVGQAFKDLALIAKDQYGNHVPGVLVDWVHQSGDRAGFLAVLEAHTGVTDAAGEVSVRAAANHVAGAEVLDVTLDGLRFTNVFSLGAIPDAVATLRADWASSPQTAAAGGAAFANPLGVTAQDRWGNAVPGATVLFTAPASGASCRLSGFTAATDAAGHAAVTATSRDLAGGFVVTASSGGASTTFSLTNAPAAPGALVPVAAATSGAGQHAAVDAAFAAALTVTVVDAYGNPVPGTPVAFAAPASGASAALSATALVTDALGQATVRATANTVAGAYQVVATAEGVAAPVAFALVNDPGAPAAVAASPATATQSAQVATSFAARLAATIRDVHGNAVPGVPVRFAAPAAGASATLAATLAVSDAAGQVAVEAVAGTLAGAYQVSAAVEGLAAPAAFSLTNLAGAAGSLTVAAGSPQEAVVDAAFAAPLQVQVRDRWGNPVPGVTVAFAAPASGATALLSAASATTGADGRCAVTATAGTASGGYRVTASAAGVALPVQLGLANLAGPAAAVAALPGASAQAARVGDPFAAPLTAAVTDAHGNPVAGAAVAFACPAATACTLDAASAVSDADGRAAVKATAGSSPAAFDATATVAGLAPATFHLVSQVGLPGTIESTGGAAQEAQVFAAFGSPLAVVVKDRFGNPVPAAEVAFEVLSTGLQSASLTAFSATTDQAGAAAVSATANLAQGRYAVRASAPGVAAPAVFELQNRPLATATAVRAALAVAATVTGEGDAVHVRVDVTSEAGLVPTGQVRLASSVALRPLPGQAGVSWSGSVLTVTLESGTAGVDLQIADWRSQTLTATYLPDVSATPTFAGSTVTVPLRASVEESVSGGCASGGLGSLWGLLLVALALVALRRRPASARLATRAAARRAAGRKVLASGLLGLLLLAPAAARAAPVLGLRLGYASAAGDAVSGSPMSEGARAAVPIQLDAGWRLLDRLTVGGFASWGPAAVGRFCAGASCSGSQLRFGAQASWRFDPTAGVAPWVGAGIGWEQTRLKATSAADTLELTRAGLELLDLQVGGDVALGGRFTVGPFLQLSLGRYVRQEVVSPLGDSSGGVSHPSTHSWLQIGVRGTVAL